MIEITVPDQKMSEEFNNPYGEVQAVEFHHELWGKTTSIINDGTRHQFNECGSEECTAIRVLFKGGACSVFYKRS
mgnify:CR=1 FL=1